MNINENNWTYTQYQSKPLRAFVSLGAIPVEDINGALEVQYQYLVTMTDEDYIELFQSTHLSLNEAIKVINEKYGHWDFNETNSKNSGDGCSSCAAH